MKKNHSKRALKVLTALALVAAVGLPSVPVSMFQASAEQEPAKKYYADFTSYAEEQAAAREFNEELAEESYVLMKNAENTLPLSLKNEKYVSVFGTRSDNLILGGSGSGGGSVANSATVKQSLNEAGFKTNPVLERIYANTSATAEPETTILDTAQDSYKIYNDAAIVVISRTGSEFNDAALYGVAGHTNMMDQNYSLDDNEKDLIMLAKANFEKVIVVINSAHPVELGDLNAEKTEDNLGVDAILWMGHPGVSGAMALGRILNGSVNPSGKTSDVYPTKFSKDPTWANYKVNIQSRLVEGYKLMQDAEGKWHYDVDEEGNKQQELYIDVFYTPEELNADSTLKNVIPPQDKENNNTGSPWLAYTRVKTYEGEEYAVDGPAKSANFYATIDYEEDIYMGYRWYETAYAEVRAGNYVPAGYETIANLNERANAWYADNVVYPFGYGLSYTEFEWTIEADVDTNLYEGMTGETTVTMTVKNTGAVAGKTVGEIYVHAPYTKGGIEKAEVALVDFVKSDVLAPGQTQTLTVTFDTQYLASYDYTDANEDKHVGYELEAGNYTLGVYASSHEACAIAEFKVEEQVNYDKDNVTGATITNLFTGDDGKWDGTRSDPDYYTSLRTAWISPDSQMKLLSRADFEGTYPQAPTEADLRWSDEAIKHMDAQVYYTSFNDQETDPWYKGYEDMVGMTQASEADVAARVNGKTEIQLYEMAGVAFDDPMWDTFMNQLTYDEMCSLIENNRFQSVALAAIGKEKETDADGPAQFSSGTFWVCEVNIASTWNKDLAYKQGLFVGNESLFLNVQGWYGPGLNIHRNPAAGRNFEYYSQDGMHNGLIAAEVIKGAASKGVITYMKHLFLNDQESNRYTASTFASEQALREIYARPWELAIKTGNATASMTAFNKVGLLDTNCHYNLYVGLLKNEFGWVSHSVTDMFGWNYNAGTSGDMAARIGVTPLGSWNNTFGRNIEGEWDAQANCVKVTFTTKITNGTDWTVNVAEDGTVSATSKAFNANNPGNINEVNNGASAAYKEPGVLYEEGDTKYSYTQWYAVRSTAQRVLYDCANSNLMDNGLNKALVAYEAIDATYGQRINTSVAVNTAEFGTANVVYSAEGLPEGLTVNATTGAISGTVTELGRFNATITVLAEDYIEVTARLTINVAANASATTGEAIILTPTIYNVGDRYNNATVSSSTVEVVTEENVQFVDGVITGTFNKAGTYFVIVNNMITYPGNSGAVNRATITSAYAIEVTGEDIEAPEVHGGIVSIEKTATEGLVDTYTVTFEDGCTMTYTVTNGANGADGKDGANGADGKDGANGADGKDGQNGKDGKDGVDGADGKDGADALEALGCSASITGTAVAAFVTLAGALLFCKKED